MNEGDTKTEEIERLNFYNVETRSSASFYIYVIGEIAKKYRPLSKKQKIIFLDKLLQCLNSIDTEAIRRNID